MHHPPPSPGLGAARDAWLEDGRFRRLSADTLREYRRVSAALLAFVRVEVGEEPQLEALTARHVRRWLLDRPRELQPASVAAYVRALRAFSRWCAAEYGVPEPLAGLKPPRVEPPAIAVFRPEQLRDVGGDRQWRVSD